LTNSARAFGLEFVTALQASIVYSVRHGSGIGLRLGMFNSILTNQIESQNAYERFPQIKSGSNQDEN